MIKIGEKGEKMSLRKGLTLLMLVAFGLSSVAPAFAVTTATVNGGVTPSIAQDVGTAANGAKPDVDVINITFDVGANELDLASIADFGDGATVTYTGCWSY